MRQINVGIIGVGWCGGIRAHACAANPLVKGLYIAEIKPDRLAEIAAATKPVKATTEWKELLAIKEIDAIYISAITMVELCYLVEKGRLPQSNLLSLDSLLDDAESVLTLVPLDSGVSRALRQVPRDDVPDMPDRIIAATGLYLNVPVVTRDPHIQVATITSIW